MDTRDKVRTLKAQGMNGSEIARELGITRQRVSQILHSEIKNIPHHNTTLLKDEVRAAHERKEPLRDTMRRLKITYSYLGVLRNKLGLTRLPYKRADAMDIGWYKTADQLDPQLRSQLNDAVNVREQAKMLFAAGAGVPCVVDLLKVRKQWAVNLRREMEDREQI